MKARAILGDAPVLRVLQQSAMLLGDPEDRRSLEKTAQRLARKAGYAQYPQGEFLFQAALEEAWKITLPEHVNLQGREHLDELTQQIQEMEEKLRTGLSFAREDLPYRWYFGYAAILQLFQQIQSQNPFILVA